MSTAVADRRLSRTRFQIVKLANEFDELDIGGDVSSYPCREQKAPRNVS